MWRGAKCVKLCRLIKFLLFAFQIIGLVLKTISSALMESVSENITGAMVLTIVETTVTNKTAVCFQSQEDVKYSYQPWTHNVSMAFTSL